MLQAVDRVLKEYNLPPFYYPPSYHVSLAWCLGDKVSRFTSSFGVAMLRSRSLYEWLLFQAF